MKTLYISKYPDQNGFINWTNEEDQTWETLIDRQMKLVQDRASEEFLEGLNRIGFSKSKIPQHRDVNKRLKGFTGWEVEVVPALIPAKDFFNLLANKKFPAASFIRTPTELDYIQEPDIFHEFFGHVPLLTFSEYANFMQQFAKLALSVSPKDRRRLFRLFWFTVEFGLLNSPKGTKAYGGGILSSTHETVYSIDSSLPIKEEFDALKALRTPYRIDILQPLYYVLNSFEDLYKILDLDIVSLLQESKDLGDFIPRFEPKADSEL